MVELNTKLVKEVNSFLESADRSFLKTLASLERDDIMGQATVRFLMRKGHWPFTPNSEFSELLDHFFATYADKKAVDPAEYQAITFNIIKQAWDYDCVPIVVESSPPVEKKPNPGKRSKKPRMEADPDYNQEGESGSKTFKSLADHDVDTTGASDRLKKAISVQRGS